MKNILITGINGFSGSHLAEYLLNLDEELIIYGTIRGRCRQTAFIDHIKEKLHLLECDLTDYNSIQSTIDESQPDTVFHLAAMTFVPTSWRAPQETMNTNVLGTLNLLESIRKSKFSPKIHIAGSSEEYGFVEKENLPIKESCQLNPLSPYAVSKVAQNLMGYQYYRNYGMKIIRTRAFNLIGPRSGEKIVSVNIAKQIVSAERKKTKPIISIGNPATIRDFNDIRDVVNAYWLAINKCKEGEVYNIATGKGWSILQLLEQFLLHSSESFVINEDKTKIRPTDVPVLIGDSTKFRNLTDWKPSYSLKKTTSNVLEYWRKQ